LIERKTWTDLWSSIQDGRYREQRSRLLLWRDQDPSCCSIVYLIEGHPSSLETSCRDICEGALYRLMIAYQIPVLRTTDLDDTVKKIEWIMSKPRLDVFFRASDATQERVESIQRRFEKKQSIENPQTLLISMLRCISGVSLPLATAIASSYRSVSDFIDHKYTLEEDLCRITYGTAKTKHRKINRSIIDKILFMIQGTAVCTYTGQATEEPEQGSGIET